MGDGREPIGTSEKIRDLGGTDSNGHEKVGMVSGT